jgi:hypothetical protein
MTLPITVGSFAVGAIWGMEGVAYGFSISSAVLFYPALRYAYLRSPVTINDFHRAVWRPIVATLVAAGFVALTTALARPEGDALRLLNAFGQFWAVYMLVWMGLPGGRQQISKAISILRPGPIGGQLESQP